jgi:hypothetical protein
LRREKHGEINRRIQNSSKFHEIINGILQNRGIQKQGTTIYKLYFKLTLTCNAETSVYYKENQKQNPSSTNTKRKAMDDRIRNETFRRESLRVASCRVSFGTVYL